MSNKLVRRIEYRRSNITPGPWASHLTVHDGDSDDGWVDDADVEIVSEANGQTVLACRFTGNAADAVFLADAYSMIDELLDEVERLTQGETSRVHAARTQRRWPSADPPGSPYRYR